MGTCVCFSDRHLRTCTDDREKKKHGRVSLTSLPHICAQYAIPFQCGRSRGKLLVLVDIDRGAQLAELAVKFEHRAVARG